MQYYLIKNGNIIHKALCPILCDLWKVSVLWLKLVHSRAAQFYIKKKSKQGFTYILFCAVDIILSKLTNPTNGAL